MGFSLPGICHVLSQHHSPNAMNITITILSISSCLPLQNQRHLHQITQNDSAAPSAKNHSAGRSKKSRRAVWIVNHVCISLRLFSSAASSVHEAASIIFLMGPARMGI